MNMLFGLPVRFGFTATMPPKEPRIELTAADLISGSHQPTDEFVARVAQKLIGQDDADPRAAVVQNTVAVLGSDEQVLQEFKYHLENKVFLRLRSMVNWLRTPAQDENLPRRDRWLDGWLSKGGYLYRAAKRRSGYIAEHAPEERNSYGLYQKNRLMNGLQSVHFPHFDYDHGMLSLMYGPNQDIRGGNPTITDVRHFVREHKKHSVRRFAPVLVPVRGQDRQMLKTNYTQELSLDTQNDRPIFMVLNRRDDHVGIAHGVSPVEITGEHPIRTVHYSELSDQPKSIETWC